MWNSWRGAGIQADPTVVPWGGAASSASLATSELAKGVTTYSKKKHTTLPRTLNVASLLPHRPASVLCVAPASSGCRRCYLGSVPHRGAAGLLLLPWQVRQRGAVPSSHKCSLGQARAWLVYDHISLTCPRASMMAAIALTFSTLPWFCSPAWSPTLRPWAVLAVGMALLEGFALVPPVLLALAKAPPPRTRSGFGSPQVLPSYEPWCAATLLRFIDVIALLLLTPSSASAEQQRYLVRGVAATHRRGGDKAWPRLESQLCESQVRALPPLPMHIPPLLHSPCTASRTRFECACCAMWSSAWRQGLTPLTVGATPRRQSCLAQGVECHM